ncbi:MAG: alanine racemase [Rhodospirillales bacterium]|nr:alanine racemase [Rhodospirillales bacterium]
MTYSHIPTPALILDKAKLIANISRMTNHIKALGVDLRPHMKTGKSMEVARLAMAGNFGGITVSTLREADYFAAFGVTDITLAACLAPAKLDRAAALRAAGIDLKILVDHPRMAQAVAAHAGEHHVLIEIDCGEHRTGLLPAAPEIMDIARCLDAAPRATLAGVLTHAGHSYQSRQAPEMTAVAETERDAVVGVARQLHDAGMACPIVSVGSTPTATHARDLTGVSEARPGVYMFGDLFQAGIGSCTVDDIAVSVLATVIAHRRQENVMFIDAGGLALSKDRSTQALANDCAYGLVCQADSGQPIAGLTVSTVHQEHGQISATTALDFDRYPIGSQLRILPNHVCMTAAAYTEYHVTTAPGQALEIWPRCNGW